MFWRHSGPELSVRSCLLPFPMDDSPFQPGQNGFQGEPDNTDQDDADVHRRQSEERCGINVDVSPSSNRAAMRARWSSLKLATRWRQSLVRARSRILPTNRSTTVSPGSSTLLAISQAAARSITGPEIGRAHV